MSYISRFAVCALALPTVLALATLPARADLYTLAASGTITTNTIGDPAIAVGTPWSFELTYDTAAPDLDFEVAGSPDPTFGKFANTSAIPAMTFFHYRAGSYEVALHNPGEFGSFSNIDITFTSINAIDINIFAPTFFPPLAGGQVNFHADFNRFVSPPVFSSDGLPTNTDIGPASFDPNTISLLPQAGEVSSSNVTSLSLSAGLAGDFNSDGTVDAADYVSWRKTLSTDVAQYYAWRANFAATLPTGAGSELNFSVVPEPATLLPIGAAAISCLLPHRPRRFANFLSG